MNKVFIIAEAGVNHNGDLLIAKQLVDKACDAGADAVKFQTYKTENIVCKDAEKADYQKKTTDIIENQYEMLKRIELSPEMHDELIEYCKEKGIIFLSTPFDLESIQYLESLDIPIMKIPSGEITNFPYLREIGKTGRKIIMSTGMANLTEIEAAVSVLRECGSEDITLLHCNTEYPTPYVDVNLRAMRTLADTFGVQVGYSDHTEGIEIALAAVALGATVIEKHFTLDKNMEGPDHKASLEPKELKVMVNLIRNIEKALGNGIKGPSISERKNIHVVRKSIVAKKEINKGDFLNEENLTTKRPGKGLSPMLWNEVVGQRAIRSFKKDEMIEI